MTNSVITAVLLSVATNYFDVLPAPNGFLPPMKIRATVITHTVAITLPEYGTVTNSIVRTNYATIKTTKHNGN